MMISIRKKSDSSSVEQNEVNTMNYDFIDSYCMDKVGTTKDYKEEWGAFRYMIGGKMYAMLGEFKDGRPLLSVKGDPFMNITLRETFPDIIEGYYLNKEHWNSIFLDGSTPVEIVKQMLDESYFLVLRNLPKKVQSELYGTVNR